MLSVAVDKVVGKGIWRVLVPGGVIERHKVVIEIVVTSQTNRVDAFA